MNDPFVSPPVGTLPQGNYKHAVMRKILNESGFPAKLVDFMISELKFDSGEIMSSPNARQAFKASGDNPTFYLWRHLCGDCGDAEPRECKREETRVETNGPIVSCYRLRNGTLIWCITDAPRFTTAFVTPEELGSI
jgi:hypothetical protein